MSVIGLVQISGMGKAGCRTAGFRSELGGRLVEHLQVQRQWLAQQRPGDIAISGLWIPVQAAEEMCSGEGTVEGSSASFWQGYRNSRRPLVFGSRLGGVTDGAEP